MVVHHALESLRQEDHEFKDNLLHAKACLQGSGNALVYLPHMCEALDLIPKLHKNEWLSFHILNNISYCYVLNTLVSVECYLAVD